MGCDSRPKLGKCYVNYGTLRQWNVMLLLQEIEFTDSVDTSKCTCKIILKIKEKNAKGNVRSGYQQKSVCTLIGKDQK